MKILNVLNIYFTIPYFLGNQLLYFTKKGYDIHLLCSPSEKLEKYATEQGCKYHEILFTREFSILSDLKALYKLYKYIVSHKFDIVCGHTPKAGMLAMCASFLAGVKKRIYYRHGLVYETATGLKRKILIFCEKLASSCSTDVVCVSPYLLEKSKVDHLSSSHKLMVLGNGSSAGVDTKTKFNPNNISESKRLEVRSRLNIPQNAFVVGFVGRLVNDKGINELIDAYRILKKKHNSIHLLLAGPLEKRDGLSETLKKYIFDSSDIHYAGLVEEDIEYIYSNMDILVLPTHREGLGMALLEAQSMGIPVLAPSHTGSRDALINDVTGFYIDNTPESIANTVERYIKNPRLKETHGQNARSFVECSFGERLVWYEIENKLFKGA